MLSLCCVDFTLTVVESTLLCRFYSYSGGEPPVCNVVTLLCRFYCVDFTVTVVESTLLCRFYSYSGGEPPVCNVVTLLCRFYCDSGGEHFAVSILLLQWWRAPCL